MNRIDKLKVYKAIEKVATPDLAKVGKGLDILSLALFEIGQDDLARIILDCSSKSWERLVEEEEKVRKSLHSPQNMV